MSLLGALATGQGSHLFTTPAYVATRGRFSWNPLVTNSTTRARTDVTRHTITATTYGLTVHWNNTQIVGNAQSAGPNSITRKAAIVLSNGDRHPLTFGGESIGTLPAGGWLASDPLPITLDPGNFHLYAYSEVTSGQTILLADGDRLDAARGEGVAVGVDLTAGTITPNSALGVFPQAITGRTASVGRGYALIGDSVMNGGSDNYWGTGTGGFGDRIAVADGAAWANYARGGDAARLMNTTEARVQRFGTTLPFASRIVSNYGTNDWYSIGLPEMKAAMISLWTWVRAQNPAATFQATTITPYTTSTDAFATTTNQTHAHAGAAETRRADYNDWLRDGAPIIAGVAATTGATDATAIRAGGPGTHPLTGILEVADLVESARNSGRWTPGTTADGLHPSPSGYALIATALDLPA